MSGRTFEKRSMGRVLRRMAGAAIGLGAACVLASCSMLLPQFGAQPAEDQPGQEQSTQERTAENALNSACDIVRTEWGRALDPWRDLNAPEKFDGFAEVKSAHQAIIADLQEIAEQVDEPEVRAALDTTISIHARLVDDIWDGYAAVPEGHVIDIENPNDPMNLVSERFVGYKDELIAADVARYDLCGAVQDAQTAEQACGIVVGPWEDAEIRFYASADPLNGTEVTQENIDEAVERAEAGLRDLKNALAQVTAPEVLPVLEDMYGAFEDVTRDTLATTLPTAETLKMTDEEFEAYVAEGNQASEAAEAQLTTGGENLISVCGDFD